MRAVVQRVSRAEVTVAGEVVGSIQAGLLVLVGVAREDTPDDARTLAGKVAQLRVFEDDAGKMNRSLLDVAGSVLAVSQFTLLGDTRRGNRPSFGAAMEPGGARQLFARFVDELGARGVAVQQGRFGASMEVSLVNQGPVTLWLDTRAG